MKVRSPLLALVVASLFLVAGCSSGSSDGGSASTTEAKTTTTTDGGSDTTDTTDGGTDTTAPGSGGSATEAELSVGVQEGLNLPADQAACVASELSGAGLSDGALQAIADADQSALDAEDVAPVAKAIQDALVACP